MRRLTVALVLVASTAGAVGSSSSAAAVPPEPARAIPADAQQQMATTLQAIIDGGGVGATALVTGTQGTWRGAAGVTDLSGTAKAQARATDRSRAGSVTKTMVATLAMQLVQERRWRLDTTIDDVLPGLVPGHGSVTLEQLLSHRSGMPDYLNSLMDGVATPQEFVGRLTRTYTDQQLLARALAKPWDFTPGTQWAYSNTGYLVVGMMLAEETGRSVGDLLQERVFGPAQMTTASFATGVGIAGRHLSEYIRYNGGLYSLAGTDASVYTSTAAVVATNRDLDRFLDALMRGRLLRRDLVDSMLLRRTTDHYYGLGIYAVGDPCPSADGSDPLMYGHDGSTFGTRTMSFTSRDGKRQVTVAWTGRDFSDHPAEVPLTAFLVAAMRATCTR